MELSTAVAAACLAAAGVIGALTYAPDLGRVWHALRRFVRALATRPRHH